MRYPGFVGPAYLSTVTRAAASDLCVNLFVEMVETAEAENAAILVGTPGIASFAGLAAGPVRALFHEDGRAFAVSGARFYEFFPDGTSTDRGGVKDAADAAQIVSNGQAGHQLLVLSGGKGYIYDLVANILTQVEAVQFPDGVRQVGFIDGYFVALIPGTSQFRISNLLKGHLWDGLDVAQRSTASDNLVGAITDHRELWLFGSQTGEIWIDSGEATFPFKPLQGTVMSVGLVAPFSLAALKATTEIGFLGRDSGGAGVFVVGNGYTPKRVSTHAVDNALKNYRDLFHARGYSYQEDGHTFYALVFAEAGTAWVYDASESAKAGRPLWHERRRWNVGPGTFEAPIQHCHCYAFDRHLVGSRIDGTVYTQALTTYTDAGARRRYVRRAPFLNKEHKRQFHSHLELVMEMGVGLGAGTNPMVTLRSTDDNANTFQEWEAKSFGDLGAFPSSDQRIRWDRLGSTPTDRAYEVSILEQVAVRIVDAYLDVK